MRGPQCPSCGARGLGHHIQARRTIGDIPGITKPISEFGNTVEDGRLILMLGVSGWLPTDPRDVEHNGEAVPAWRLNNHAKANTTPGVMPRTSRRERSEPQYLMKLPLVVECALCRQWALVEYPRPDATGTR
jgi:hypothetical protein